MSNIVHTFFFFLLQKTQLPAQLPFLQQLPQQPLSTTPPPLKNLHQQAPSSPLLPSSLALPTVIWLEPGPVSLVASIRKTWSFQDTMKTSRKRRSRLWKQPCFVRFKTLGLETLCGVNKPNIRRSKYACVVDAHESARKRTGKD